MTEKQLLDFCKSQNWSTKLDGTVVTKSWTRNFIRIKDIGIRNTVVTISYEINESTKEITFSNITFYGGITDGSGKTYYAHPKNDTEMCDFIIKSVERYKKFSSRLTHSTITKLQNKIEQLQNEIERIKLFI